MFILISIFTIYIAFKVGLDVYEALFIKEEVTNSDTSTIMNKKEYIEAGLYAVYKRIIDIFSSFASLFVVVTLLFGGLYLINYFDKGDSLTTIFAYFVVTYIVSLPITIYQIIIDKRFGFYKGDWKLFIKDEIKKIILTIVIGGILFYFLIYFIDNFYNWWIYGFGVVFIFLILINLLFPYFMMWFNKFTPLDDKNLELSIEDMMKKVDFKSNGIFVMDASKRDGRLNAFFGGLGKSKRVVLFDTLLEKLSNQEILAVLGHELGHFKHKDILKNIAIVGIMLFGLFFILGHLPNQLFEEIRVEKSAGNILVLGFIISEIYFFIFSPIINFISRHNEFEADRMGAELGGGEHLKKALYKLVKENKHFPKSSKIFSLIYHSHPSILERVEKL